MKPKKNNPTFFLSLLRVAMLLPLSVFALETDPDQPILIDSNTATYDDKTATSTYTGKVVCNQGSIHVEAEKLVVYFKDGDAEKLVFTGNKAKFRQKPDVDSQDITGEALTGEYYPKKNLLVLIDQAIVRQGTGTYSSHIIEYDSKNAFVKAGEKSSDSKRVHVVIQPKDKANPAPAKKP